MPPTSITATRSPGSTASDSRKPNASKRWILSYESAPAASRPDGRATRRVLRTRPSAPGVNMPATITTPSRSATARTPEAHGPSSGSAISGSGFPNARCAASGNTTSSAPCRAASSAKAVIRARFSAGSGELMICASAIFMVLLVMYT
ncbi:hypothetical protein BC477_16285 [Clavibacter michiganensis subsp. michiganensis]|nr:hypothetical protein BC477_16285 [Clavibacter michiganensis subsp. michiganensis]